MRVSQQESNAKQAMDAMLGTFQNMMTQQSASANLQTRLQDLIKEIASWDALKGDMEKLTVETFTESELDNLIAFYKTSSGQSIASKMGTFATRSAALGQERAMAMMPKIQELSREMSARIAEAARQNATAPKPLPAK
jgi:hypothetical protein